MPWSAVAFFVIIVIKKMYNSMSSSTATNDVKENYTAYSVVVDGAAMTKKNWIPVIMEAYGWD